MDLRETQKNDPLKRNVEKNLHIQEFSPMDPPPAYEPLKQEELVYKEASPYIQKLIDEHRMFEEKLGQFETVLLSIQKEGFQKETQKKLSEFFSCFDQEILKHQRKEEVLFPLLREKLLESGEHSQNGVITPVDVMEEDHTKSIQRVAVVFNFFGLAFRLPDEKSRLITLDTAIEQGKSFVEELRLHFFREENIIFPLVHKYHLTIS